MKILITGGCGFLGSNLAASYLGEGAEVVILDALLRIGGESNLAWLQEAASRAGCSTVSTHSTYRSMSPPADASSRREPNSSARPRPPVRSRTTSRMAWRSCSVNRIAGKV